MSCLKDCNHVHFQSVSYMPWESTCCPQVTLKQSGCLRTNGPAVDWQTLTPKRLLRPEIFYYLILSSHLALRQMTSFLQTSQKKNKKKHYYYVSLSCGDSSVVRRTGSPQQSRVPAANLRWTESRFFIFSRVIQFSEFHYNTFCAPNSSFL